MTSLLNLVPKKYVGILDCVAFRPFKSYSQHGEDIIASRYFDYHGRRTGVYVDIGCFHPKHHSTTYRLYKRGWHGINIDVDPYKIDVFKFVRPRDINICVAVSDRHGVAEFFYQSESLYGSMAGLDEKTIREEAGSLGRRVHQRTVQTMPLNDVLHQNRITQLDFLSIDVEGHEAVILSSFDFASFPVPLIAVEVQGSFDEIQASPTHKLLKNNGYSLYARTGPTVFYNL